MGDFQLFGDDDDDDDDDDNQTGAGNDLAQRLGLIVTKWEVETPDGHKLRTDGSRRDHRDGLEALRTMLEARPLVGRAVAGSSLSRMTLNEAIKDYAEVEGAALKPNTWSQRSRALQAFAETIGGHLRIGVITRPMASVWSVLKTRRNGAFLFRRARQHHEKWVV